MTEQQIKVEALLAVAKQQLDSLAASVEVLRALNRGDDMVSYCEISNRASISLEATVMSLLGAHKTCFNRAISQAGQIGGLVN